KNGTVFSFYTKAKSKSLQAGTYLLNPSMNAEDVIEQMSSGNVHRPALYKVTIK
ncbi:endolytic transglycosylase MltG, partial [Priestia megaterium]|nr:endolytic transglycosylase MltG [Priestia megaterium]